MNKCWTDCWKLNWKVNSLSFHFFFTNTKPYHPLVHECYWSFPKNLFHIRQNILAPHIFRWPSIAQWTFDTLTDAFRKNEFARSNASFHLPILNGGHSSFATHCRQIALEPHTHRHIFRPKIHYRYLLDTLILSELFRRNRLATKDFCVTMKIFIGQRAAIAANVEIYFSMSS